MQTGILSKLLIYLIRFYQVCLSYFVKRGCRYEPSCSCYGIESIRRHGAIRGIILTSYRIVRCNPFGGSGYDAVPKDFVKYMRSVIGIEGKERR